MFELSADSSDISFGTTLTLNPPPPPPRPIRVNIDDSLNKNFAKHKRTVHVPTVL